MPDRIKLLQDNIVNQIAAGEVIQRPASVVKELLDNAVDAGATEIKLLVKNYGNSLIQVNDNGCGMSPTDARMAFERHATSKIQSAEDLFRIQTKGFRGEALASIAAVAQVELKTRTADEDVGTFLEVRNSQVIKQEPCACLPGTQISVKNLFYNTPARRKFLKANAVELRHIQEEFIFQALAYPEIHFSYSHNDQEIYFLPPSGLRQRIIAIYGKRLQDYLLPVQPESGLLEVTGFIGKPELAKKTKGEQLIFVNRRHIRNPYLAHAVKSAYEDLIPADHHPFYILFLSIEPDKIDVNVHPTKQEIKFDDERLIYHFLKVSVRFALGKFALSPQIDFEQAAPGMDNLLRVPNRPPATFENSGNQASWFDLSAASPAATPAAPSVDPLIAEATPAFQAVQLHNSYLVLPTKSGITFIDQHLAHERILYEYFLNSMRSREIAVQKLLFPQILHVSKTDAQLLRRLLPMINAVGFEMEDFGSDSFIINGIPSLLLGKYNEEELLHQMLHQYRLHDEFELSIEENVARSLAKTGAIRRGQPLNAEEITALVEQLFLCEMPYANPFGKKCVFALSLDEINKKFN